MDLALLGAGHDHRNLFTFRNRGLTMETADRIRQRYAQDFMTAFGDPPAAGNVLAIATIALEDLANVVIRDKETGQLVIHPEDAWAHSRALDVVKSLRSGK